MWLSFSIRVFDCVSIHVSLICETLFTLFIVWYNVSIFDRKTGQYRLFSHFQRFNFKCWILICHLMIVLSTKNGYIVRHIMFVNDVHEIRNKLELTIILNERFSSIQIENEPWHKLKLATIYTLFSYNLSLEIYLYSFSFLP